VVQPQKPLVALGVLTIACAALILALRPSFTPMLIAEPAVSAISLGFAGSLGRNQRFATIGGFAPARLRELCAWFAVSELRCHAHGCIIAGFLQSPNTRLRRD
jgi:hypothetical protein